jgi:hypothetical protein
MYNVCSWQTFRFPWTMMKLVSWYNLSVREARQVRSTDVQQFLHILKAGGSLAIIAK